MCTPKKFDALMEKIIKFQDDRDWKQFHDPKNIADAITIEAAELQEIFLWMSTEQSWELSPDKIDRIKEELADIFICSTYLCVHFGIDILNAVEAKIEKNNLKYPVDKAKGSNLKYTEL
jgi:NTP pyrophosphatase (non-canonical NTP hydrolase)